MRLQVFVGAAELVVAEPAAAVGGEGGGVDGFEDEVPVRVDEGAFPLGVGAPEKKYEVLFLVGEAADDGVGEGFPAFILVGARLVGAHGEGGVEEEDTLVGPAFQIARCGDGNTEVVFNLFEDVLERGRLLDAFGDGEGEPVRLSGTVIGVLSEDDDFGVVHAAMVEGVEDEFAGRIYPGLPVFVPDETGEGFKVRFLEFFAEQFFPGGFYLYVHDSVDIGYGLRETWTSKSLGHRFPVR